MAAMEPTHLIQKALNHEPIPSPELIAEAEEAEKDALRRTALVCTTIVNVLLGFMYSGRAVWTSSVPTEATTVTSDGFVLYMRNPQFLTSVDEQGRVVLKIHEALHPLYGHFNHAALTAEGIDPSSPVATLAFEANLNYWATLIAGGGRTSGVHAPMPLVDGSPVGVDWEKVYKDYCSDLKKQGLAPVSVKEFYATDLATYRELSRMTAVKQPKQPNWCSHTPGSAGESDTCGSCGGSKPDTSTAKGTSKGKSKASAGSSGTDAGDTSEPSPGPGSGVCTCPSPPAGLGGIDKDAAGKIAEAVVGEVLREALNGSEAARADLIDLMGKFDDSDEVSQMFGNLGAGQLIGNVPTQKSISWVSEYVRSILDARLRPGQKLVRREKIWWDNMLAYRGEEKVKKGIIAFDASASMPHNIVERFTELIGEEKGLELAFWSFDADVWPSADTEGIRGGGGTSFRPVYDLACEEEEDVNFLLYVTDGYAPQLVPDRDIDADKIVWIITPGGDDWPARDMFNQMESVHLESWADIGL